MKRDLFCDWGENHITDFKNLILGCIRVKVKIDHFYSEVPNYIQFSINLEALIVYIFISKNEI